MEKKTGKRLPYGNTNFESIRTENYVYIDKTRYIELLENEGNKNLFFTRPRKFGKSLFFSMLSYYYDFNQANKFEQLFGDLYIGQHPTPRKNSYLVLEFDFSGLDTSNEADFKVSFSQKIQDVVYIFLNRYKHLFPEGDIYNKQIDDQKPGVASLWKAFAAAESIDKKIYVIIDEYDHVANDLIAMGTYKGDDMYRNIIWANGVIRDFYETLKEGSKTVIDRIILTGITPVMLDDVTSGFNISNNISLKQKYNEILGFTEEEVNILMEEVGIERNMINVNMEFLYNGYRFHADGEHRVYNPSMMLYLLDQIQSEGKVQNVIDDNLKMDYGRLERLIQKNRDQLTQITQNNGILSKLIPKFSIKQLLDSKNFASLLFYMGMLTVDKEEEGVLRLKIPNYSIRTVFWEYIEQMLVDNNSDVLVNMDEQIIALRELAYRGNPHLFIEYVSKNIFSRLSNRDLRNFDEKYIKIILLHSLFQSNLYVTITELEVSQGYTDIYMQRSHLYPDVPYEWVWEIKYISKQEATDSVLETKRKEAHVQLEKYRDSALFADRTDIRYLSIIFIGKDKYEIEEIVPYSKT
jgi:hypothetical protein